MKKPRRIFFGVNGLVAFDLTSIPDLSREKVIEHLRGKGFECPSVDITNAARSRIGQSVYIQGARQHLAPSIVECKSFISWSYAQIGIRISRQSLQAFGNGDKIDPGNVHAGDMIFIEDLGAQSKAHVGMATCSNRIIHAQRNVNIKEIDLERFVGDNKIFGITRIVDDIGSILTVKCPDESDVICSSDIEFMLKRMLLTV